MMGRRGGLRLIVILIGVLAALGVLPAQAATARTTGQWILDRPPNVASNTNILVGVAAVSPSDVWAVGDAYDGTINQTLIEHWNGASWSVVPSPNQGTDQSVLDGVAAVSSSDVWAVGNSFVNNQSGIGTQYHTLIEHWNGSSWSIVPSPDIAATGIYLVDVAALSSTNVWAVGYDSDGPLIEHYDGAAWSVVPGPTPRRGLLTGIAAVSSSNIWAVGSYYGTVNGTDMVQTLIEHWNGSAWSIVPSPNAAACCGSSILRSVAAVSASDVWAVGNNVAGSRTYGLIEHYNGSTWSVVSSPDTGKMVSQFSDVVAVSSTDVRVVGFQYGKYTPVQPLIEHWNGSTWAVIPAPSTSTPTVPQPNPLYAVATSGNATFAVGNYMPSSTVADALALRWIGGAQAPSVAVVATGNSGGHPYVVLGLNDASGLLQVAGTRATNCTLAITQVDGKTVGGLDITPVGTAAKAESAAAPYPTSAQVTITMQDATKACVAKLDVTNANFATAFIVQSVTSGSLRMVESHQADSPR